MGILADNVDVNSETVEATVQKIKKANTNFYNVIRVLHESGFNLVWDNPNHTAKEIIDAMGTDAVALFRVSGGIQDLCAMIDPNYAPLVPPKAFTINEDGTVTIGE